MDEKTRGFIHSLTLDHIDKSIWFHQNKLYIVSKNMYRMGEFLIQQLDGETLPEQIYEFGVAEALFELKSFLIKHKFFYVCQYTDIDMDSILEEKGFI